MKRNVSTLVAAMGFICSTAVFADVTVQQALNAGCYDNQQMREIIDTAKAGKPIGSRTLEKENELTSTYGAKITDSRVTAPATWVYRAYEGADTNNWHVQKLKAGVIYAKAQNDLDKYIKNGGTPEKYWAIDGPDLHQPDFPSATYTTMRLLALQSSDTPQSQFVSFALDYATTGTFGEAVYALQVNPNSPILGLVNCKTAGGEVQVQILGGTTFDTLYRKLRTESVWKRYDRKTDTWIAVPNGTVPEKL
ncbi:MULTISPECIES: hypothetical protein [Pseudomonas]|uniref:DUF1329 domain-containing protein n=1 Tax=Pseudomonas haemolytica TaxID=2600065 RepID=A0A5P1D727_9PSED|nr:MULTISPECIES: hypothetical protein [Pseudomonas]MBJ2247428.1 hypothetical protein [Pseudomonas haemolytica]MBJ2272238.1 hypothetical protein [Pseudomonas haemolytica]MBJ2282819.1 hypothetical protein [Pseudomonas sp. MF6755]MBK3450088.1 hypothetical protein [Pseudomonas haemolytica]MBK3461669.1 hypothetical protein [Pseudomonas haemolytica]